MRSPPSIKQKHHGFVEFPADWLMDTPRQRLTRDEQYCCILLKFRAWAEPQDKIATLPDDDLFLSECAEVPLKEFKRIKVRVMGLEFALNETTKRWEHVKLMRYKISYSEMIEQARLAGVKSGEVRRNKMKGGSKVGSNEPSTDLQRNERTLNGPSKVVRTNPRTTPELPVPFPVPFPVLKDSTHILEFFEILWNAYPAKDGRKEAIRHYTATVKTEQDLKDIQKALDNYWLHLKANPWKHPKNGDAWFNNWRDWINWQEPKGGKNGRSRAGFTEPDLSTY